MNSPPIARKRKRSVPQIEGAQSLAELILLNRISLLRLPTPETQVELLPGRKFRFDVVFTEYKVAVECDGGVWTQGRHTRGSGYESDATKSALAQIAGYMVIHVTPGMVESGVAGLLILEALKARGWRPPT